MEQVEVGAPLTSKPAEYQPVPTAGINSNYPTIATSPPQTFITQDTHYNGPRPNNYLVLTLITLFCCMGYPTLFCSIIAVVYSLQVDLAWDVGHHSGARSASNNAKNWAIGAIITGIIIAVSVGVFVGIMYGVGVGSAASSTYNRRYG